MPAATNPLWRRWEADSASFSVDELMTRWTSILAPLHSAGVLRPSVPATDWWCDECCESHLIEYHDTANGPFGFVVGDCGVTRLKQSQTDQFQIDTERLLALLFAGSRLSIQPSVGEWLWNIGRHTIGSRSRELRFVRGISPRTNGAIVDKLKSQPKAILFTPSVGCTAFWQRQVPCLVLALEEITTPTSTAFTINWESIGESFEIHTHVDSKPTKPRQKRGTRTAKIERLRDELKRHLASAADHAVATADSEGCAALLPRPSKTELAKLAGMSKSDVTRCFTDPTASELRLLWDTADNLEAVLRLRGRSVWSK
ncbi:hypothetical protein SH139x_002819 [Planctomycetaceae bacterium SH139]